MTLQELREMVALCASLPASTPVVLVNPHAPQAMQLNSHGQRVHIEAWNAERGRNDVGLAVALVLPSDPEAYEVI